MKKRSRAVRREEERAQAKLARDVEKLAELAPGGAPARPLEIATPAEVEVLARSTPCPVCRGELRVLEHTAEVLAGARLRVARCACARCGRERPIYFRLASTMLN